MQNLNASGNQSTDVSQQVWKLKIVNAKQLNPKQNSFNRLFYWACYYGNSVLVNLFLCKLGVSPFVKTFFDRNCIDACVLGDQYELLEYMVKDTKEVADGNRGKGEISAAADKLARKIIVRP